MSSLNRLRLFIILFSLALAVPMGYFVHLSKKSLAQEEAEELHFFARSLMERMEADLSELITREEERPLDEYGETVTRGGPMPWNKKVYPSPLTQEPEETFIVGYVQINPDGSVASPRLRGEAIRVPAQASLSVRLRIVENAFRERKSFEVVDTSPPPNQPQPRRPTLVEKYFRIPAEKGGSRLGRQGKRVVTAPTEQVLNLAPEAIMAGRAAEAEEARDITPPLLPPAASEFFSPGAGPEEGLQVVVEPMRSIFVDEKLVYVYRNIILRQRVFRQGFLVEVESLLKTLVHDHFMDQPIAEFAGLVMRSADREAVRAAIASGVGVSDPVYVLEHTFPQPFSFVSATLATSSMPRSAGRATLNIMIVALGVVFVAGLFAIYRSAQVVVETSERRSSFVSSVTHELKTPLTNIRMYIEMLDQGMATTEERRKQYFRILGSETTRLSRLINNVLEFAKLERKQRAAEMDDYDLGQVVSEVKQAMSAKLASEGFGMSVDLGDVGMVRFDREMMIQILINLIENSVKFSKQSERKEIELVARREPGRTLIEVKDYGPGIPQGALKKVFDDFYRVEGSLTRSTAGTGIGLALVRKFVESMGGTVRARNNDDEPGLTISIALPDPA